MFNRLNRIKNRPVDRILGPRINRDELRDTLVIITIVLVTMHVVNKTLAKL